MSRGVNTHKNIQRPWTELYRPDTLKDIILQPTERELLESILKHAPNDKNSESSSVPQRATVIPNMIICGPPGTGKTTTLLCLARQLLGDRYASGVIELNSSNDRGLPAIESLKDFCKKSSTYINEAGKTCNFPKIIIFDEADRITDKAQMAIAELMCKYSGVAFTFTCNDSTLIVGDIQSKCTILRYKPTDRKVMAERLITICDAHQAKWTKTGIEEIVLDARGDMRRAINIAQSVWSGYNEITPETIRKLHPRPPTEALKSTFNFCKQGKLNKALALIHTIQNEGTSSQDIMTGMQNYLLIDTEIEPNFRMHCIASVGRAMYASSSFQTALQLDACIANMAAPALLK